MTSFTGELIGKQIAVVTSTNPSDVNITGIIVDETKNTIKVKQEKMVKTLLKKNITFTVNGKVVEGKTIVKRPEDRIK